MAETAMGEAGAVASDRSGVSRAEESVLIQAARRDPTVFGELYKRYLARIYAYLRARSQTDEDAANLTEHVFLRAREAFSTYRGRGVPFAAWLIRIARNVAVDAGRRRRSTVDWDAVPESAHPVDEESPEAIVLRRERLARMRALLAGLPPEKRELVALRFAASLTLREIAAVVGKSESTVREHLAATLRLLAALRPCSATERRRGWRRSAPMSALPATPLTVPAWRTRSSTVRSGPSWSSCASRLRSVS